MHCERRGLAPPWKTPGQAPRPRSGNERTPPSGGGLRSLRNLVLLFVPEGAARRSSPDHQGKPKDSKTDQSRETSHATPQLPENGESPAAVLSPFHRSST